MMIRFFAVNFGYVLAIAMVAMLAACGTSSKTPWYIAHAEGQNRQTQQTLLNPARPDVLPQPRSQQSKDVIALPVTQAGAGQQISVSKGETLYGIARRTGTPLRALIDANKLRPPYTLQIGHRLVIPVMQRYHVKGGDTLYSISRRYGVDMASLASLNNLKAPYGIVRGQVLRVSSSLDANQLTTDAESPVVVNPQPQSPFSWQRVAESKRTGQNVLTPLYRPSKKGPQFVWPVKGGVLSGYGPKSNGQRNDGVNISTPEGSIVRAAADGVVAYADDGLAGYGRMLLIRHKGGWVTAYAHNAVLLVKRGDRVRQEQAIARSGRTGNVTIPQVHFQIRKGGNTINPVKHLG
ncbi:MAG: LysM peptidoglycan-binding domain-containing M23 family metallopeptidase [Parvularculales bacterium]